LLLLLLLLCTSYNAPAAQRKAGSGGKTLRFAFCQTPAQLLVDNELGRSVSLRCHRTLLEYAADGSVAKSVVDSQQVRDFGRFCGNCRGGF
jgi:hypothetical protein